MAIVCKTPKFKDLKIDKPVQVQFLLRRPSDIEQSDPVDFTYVPFNEGKICSLLDIKFWKWKMLIHLLKYRVFQKSRPLIDALYLKI